MSDENGAASRGVIECPQLAEFDAYLARMVDEIMTLGRGLSPGQFNWKPSEDEWSVGQCVVHLTDLTSAMRPILTAAIADARAEGRTAEGPFTYGPLTRKFLGIVGPESRRAGKRATAPGKPVADELDRDETLAEFERVHRELATCMHDADGLNLSRVKAKSALLPLVRMPIGAWLEMTPAHAERHLLQMRDVVGAEGFPAAP